MSEPLCIFRNEDGTIEITAGQAYDAGAVVIVGDILGIAKTPIANGETAALATEGIFTVPKEGAVSAKAMGVGKRVYWDAVNSVAVLAANATVGMKFLGITTKAALTADTTVEIVLCPDATATAATVAAAETSHSLNATFSNTEVQNALNALGTKLNSVLTLLKAEGRVAGS